MNFWNILTADVRLNPIVSRHFFSRLRFAREDRRVEKLPLAPLPVVQGELPRGGQGPVLFAVADVGYFNRFANMFASSASMASAASAVHIHVLGDKPEIQIFDKQPRHFTLTYEAADFSKMSSAVKGRYCQCMRFARMIDFVKATNRDYIAFDIDGLFQKSFSGFKFEKDVGLILRPENTDPGMRVNAGVVYMKATPPALDFMQCASTHMLRHVQHAPFTEKLDQRCLALSLNRNVAALPPEIYTFEPGQGYFYSAKGNAKNEVLRQVYKKLQG